MEIKVLKIEKYNILAVTEHVHFFTPLFNRISIIVVIKNEMELISIMHSVLFFPTARSHQD